MPIAPASSANAHRLLFLDLIANGRNRRERKGSKRDFRVSLDVGRPAVEEEMPVEMFTVMLPLMLAGTDSLSGLKLQLELAGSALHESVNVPADPFRGVTVSVKLAFCPLAIVSLVWPAVAMMKSNPNPESGTCTGAAIDSPAIVSLPSCGPALEGANEMSTVHASPTSRDAPQLLPTRTNSADVES